METKVDSEELDLQQYWLALKRRWPVIVGVMATCLGLSAIVASLQRPTYQATGALLFQSNRAPALSGVGQGIGDLPSLRQGDPIGTQAEILMSQAVAFKVIETLQLKDKDGKPLSPASLKLKTESKLGTDVLGVSYTSKDAKLAEAVVNEAMKAYIASNLLANRAETSAAATFIQKQLSKAKTELDQSAEALRQFKTRNQVVDLTGESTAAVATMSALNNQLNDVQAQLADIAAQQFALRQQIGLSVNQAVNLTSLSQAPGVREVLLELQKVQTKLATERSRYRGKHPSIVTLESQEASLNVLLQQRIREVIGRGIQFPPGALQAGELKQKLTSDFVVLETQRLGLQNRLAALVQLRNSYKQRADILPNLEKQQVYLESRLTAAKKNYDTLSTRLQDIQIVENQNLGNARIIQPAIVSEKLPTPLKQLGFLIGGGLVGLLLGVVAAILVDLLDKSVKSVKEAQELFGYTLLGLIPKFEIGETSSLQRQTLAGVSPRVIVTTSPRTVIHEAYQMLLANLKFVCQDKQIQTVVVTSSVPQEGKTEVSANLAATLAQAGRRVLLVDADVRFPSQHHLWGLMNEIGLSNILAGQAQVTDAVQVITTHLSVLPAGVVPPNPMALLDSESMSSLIQKLSTQYDYIIFDTPPLAGVADAAILGKMVDGVLLVVQPGLVDSASAGAAKSLLMRSEPNILGLVANGVNVKHEPDTYFYSASPPDAQSLELASSIRSL